MKTISLPKCYIYSIYFKKGDFIMSELTWKGRWSELKGKVKQQYADLTDDDLLYAEGKEDELLGKLQKKTGKTKEEVEDWLDKLK
ncbi:uncharacterized protein YjbJ (UPF0337 family) [Sphingobacterium sp. JUb78]|nr:uncharacterized protein YjbJ (UPF0337 family) [Sphingobacterium sp. JUb78]